MSIKSWYAVAIIFALTFGFSAGWYVNGLRWQTIVADAKEQEAQLREQLAKAERAYVLERDTRLREAERAGLLEQQLRDAEADVIVKEVIRYVQDPDVGRCELPADWVRIHNAAAGVPGVSEATGVDDGAAGAARTDSDALPVVTANYRRCRASMARLQALQAWLSEVRYE